MGTVLVQALLLASTGLLSVGSITLVILLLLSERGWPKGLAYALGYTGAYALIGVGAVAVGYRSADGRAGEPRLFLPLLMLGLGALLLWLAWRNWRKPRSEEPEEFPFLSLVDQLTVLKAFGFGAMIAVVNFKNLALFLSALSIVILSELRLSEKLVITLLVVLLFCLAVIIPVLVYVALPGRAQLLLNAFREWLNRHNRPIGIWGPLVFGLFFLLNGLKGVL